MLFNIYYINFPKVYEIKMMISNIVQTSATVESGEEDKLDAELRAKLGAKFLNFFNSEIGSNVKSLSSDSQKVLETFEVKTTKSIVLNEVIQKSKVLTGFSDLKEGALVRIDNVNLELVNEEELRTVKMFSSGAFKGAMFQIEGIDINNALNSMLKDYAYKLKGFVKFGDSSDKLLIKIPLTFENELESLYCVDDLFIGKVSIIGIYKGKTKIGKLKNSFEFFQEIGKSNSSTVNEEIQGSQYSTSTEILTKDTSDQEEEYNYIDVLAIVQNIEPVEQEEKNSNNKRAKVKGKKTYEK